MVNGFAIIPVCYQLNFSIGMVHASTTVSVL